MTTRKRIAGFLSAGLLLANLAVAATTTPVPTPVPVTPPQATMPPVVRPTTEVALPTTEGVSPTVLWVYGDPSPQWQVLNDFDTKAACEASLATIQSSQGQDAGCFRVGVDPARLHEQYGSVPTAPVAK
jgi:hypothetical protein